MFLEGWVRLFRIVSSGIMGGLRDDDDGCDWGGVMSVVIDDVVALVEEMDWSGCGWGWG